jgi:putative membrane protein
MEISDEKIQKVKTAAEITVELAVERNELALERTLLAWVRTNIGMIGGGFALDKGLLAFRRARMLTGEAWSSNPHLPGLVFMISGTFLMVLFTIYYIKRSQKLAGMRARKKSLFSSDYLISFMIVAIGILLIIVLLSDNSA